MQEVVPHLYGAVIGHISESEILIKHHIRLSVDIEGLTSMSSPEGSTILSLIESITDLVIVV